MEKKTRHGRMTLLLDTEKLDRFGVRFITDGPGPARIELDAQDAGPILSPDFVRACHEAGLDEADVERCAEAAHRTYVRSLIGTLVK